MDPKSEAEVNALRKEKCQQFRDWAGFSGSATIHHGGRPAVEIHENTEEPLTEDQRSQITEALSPVPVHFSPTGPLKAL